MLESGAKTDYLGEGESSSRVLSQVRPYQAPPQTKKPPMETQLDSRNRDQARNRMDRKNSVQRKALLFMASGPMIQQFPRSHE